MNFGKYQLIKKHYLSFLIKQLLDNQLPIIVTDNNCISMYKYILLLPRILYYTPPQYQTRSFYEEPFGKLPEDEDKYL